MFLQAVVWGMKTSPRRPYSQDDTFVSATMKKMTAQSTFAPPDGLWIINSQGVTVYANEDMAQILGTTIAELIGKDSFLYVFPEDLNAARQLFTVKQAGDRSPFHFRLRRIDGHAIWADVQGTPMRNAAGQFLGIVGSFTVSKVQRKQ